MGLPAALLAAAVAGCGTPTAGPVFTVVPELPSIPEVTPLPPREPPAPLRDTLVLRIRPGPTAPDEFDIVNSPGAVTDEDASRPSVVVHAPVALPAGGRQALESALLRHGFAVLDRSSVDRRLEEIRDSLGALPRPPGRAPDMSLVLQAARTTATPADYLFQVERFVVTPSSDRSVMIGNRPETRAHVEANPGLGVGGDAGDVPPELPARWYRTDLSARLLDVGTGSIVWLGSHDLESPDAEADGLVVRIATERRVAGVDRINSALAEWNDRMTTLAATAAEVRADLRRVWDEGSRSREFESDEAAFAWQRETQDEAARLERRYRDLVDELTELTRTPPRESAEAWDFFYAVGDPEIAPDLAPDGPDDPGRSALIEAHLERLARRVATALVNTIVIG